MKVLSFDIGIKNLAWCLAGDDSSSTKPWVVLDWGVWDLRIDLENEPMRPEMCYAKTNTGKDCNREPSYVELSGNTIIGGLCKCHSKQSKAPFNSDNISSLRTMSVSALRNKCTEYGIDTRRRLKKEMLNELTEYMKRWCLHKIPPLKKSKTISLDVIHKRIIERIRDIHIRVDKVVIENQPVKMNAMMKSIQIILWTTLRMKMMDEGIPEPDVTFINASKKLTVVPNETTDTGLCYDILTPREAVLYARGRSYADRKHESILRVEKLLTYTHQLEHLTWFRSNSKKDDLADCLLMCLCNISSV